MTLINEKNILTNINKNKENTLKHITMVLSHHYNSIINNPKIIFFLNMVPLPKKLLLIHTDDVIDNINNNYTFMVIYIL